jgi:5-methylcytosine-specific restriction endonuclease McrA
MEKKIVRTKINRELVYRKYNGKCGYCGDDIDIKKMQVDHIIPVKGFEARSKNVDLNNINNLMPACFGCNNWKSNHSLEGFRKELSHQIERCNQYSRNYKIGKRFGLFTENNIPIKFYFENNTTLSHDN